MQVLYDDASPMYYYTFEEAKLHGIEMTDDNVTFLDHLDDDECERTDYRGMYVVSDVLYETF
jgi:hypothetical protein